MIVHRAPSLRCVLAIYNTMFDLDTFNTLSSDGIKGANAFHRQSQQGQKIIRLSHRERPLAATKLINYKQRKIALYRVVPFRSLYYDTASLNDNQPINRIPMC